MEREKVKSLRAIVLILACLIGKSAFAGSSNYLVLGVIASSKQQQGIALFKDMQSSRTFAVREGSEFNMKSFVKAVKLKTVDVVINDKLYTIPVGGDTDSAVSSGPARSPVSENVSLTDIEKNGDTVKLSKSLKEHLINNDLSKILMQAAAVPHIIDGRLAGFQLWEIEPQSVFEVAGLKNGDLITSINGYEINDVSATIKQLTSLKNASGANFEYVRNGIKQQLKIDVQ